MAMNENRCGRARQNAGLTINQAVKLLGMGRDWLIAIEAGPADAVGEHDATRLAELYRVRIEWMLGRVPLREPAMVACIKGAAKLSEHDREIIEEFAASLPRGPK
jgi:transcriptional regulator with XRE-family HTH domain